MGSQAGLTHLSVVRYDSEEEFEQERARRKRDDRHRRKSVFPKSVAELRSRLMQVLVPDADIHLSWIQIQKKSTDVASTTSLLGGLSSPSHLPSDWTQGV